MMLPETPISRPLRRGWARADRVTPAGSPGPADPAPGRAEAVLRWLLLAYLLPWALLARAILEATLVLWRGALAIEALGRRALGRGPC